MNIDGHRMLSRKGYVVHMVKFTGTERTLQSSVIIVYMWLALQETPSNCVFALS